MITKYNNYLTLTVNDASPVTDANAMAQHNSLRRIFKNNRISTFYGCQDYCRYNPQCAHYEYDNKNAKCLLYRKEPFAELDGITLEECKNECSYNGDCDYLSYTKENKCILFSKEEREGKSSVKDLWTDYAIYGHNTDDGRYSKNFKACTQEAHGDFVFYIPENYCISKKFVDPNPGNTTVFFDKQPMEQYKTIDKRYGYRGQDKERMEGHKTALAIIVIIALFYIFYIFIVFWDTQM